MPSRRSPGKPVTCRASARQSAAESTPHRSIPVSTSIMIPSVDPAATAAAESAAALSASSAATRTRWSRASSASTRSLAGWATVLTTNRSSNPAAASTTASHTVAMDSPPAPAATCRRAMSGLLWAL